MFDREKCILCGDCLVECRYNEYDREGAIEEMTALVEGRSADILKNCVTCMSCNQVCPQGANPFHLICDMQEKTGAIELPEVVTQMLEVRLQAPSEVRKGAPDKPALATCNIEEGLPRPLEGSLFDDLTRMSGGDFQCSTLWLHIGMHSRVEAATRSFIDNLAATGEKEIVFAHDDCYTTATVLAGQYGVDVPFQPIHIYEYLRDRMADRKDEIKKLDMKIAYQAPCPSRYTPEKDPILDELFEMIGVDRVARKYDRKDGLCCGVPMAFRDADRMQEMQKKNLDDAEQVGAEALALLCPGCIRGLGPGALERGMDIYMVSDLCRLALGEDIPAYPA